MTFCAQALCCSRRYKTSEKREYDQLKEALARKQEEVRRLQAQVGELDNRAINRAALEAQPVPMPSLSERAAMSIQSHHRDRLSRRGGIEASD